MRRLSARIRSSCSAANAAVALNRPRAVFPAIAILPGSSEGYRVDAFWIADIPTGAIGRSRLARPCRPAWCCGAGPAGSAGCLRHDSSVNPFDKTRPTSPRSSPKCRPSSSTTRGSPTSQSGDYESALARRFDELDRQHPYLEHGRKKALILQTFANYRSAPVRRRDRHRQALSWRCIRQSPDAAYAQYLVGMSYFNQIPDVTRDQERAEKALVALQEVVDALSEVGICRGRASKMQRGARPARRQGDASGATTWSSANYTAAINRFRNVVEPVPDHPPRSRKRWTA